MEGPEVSGPAVPGPALVGRDHPAGVLAAEVDRALASHGGLVLVTGEAGIGKTALVAGAVDHARRGGALVATGACWDRDDTPGYWPWVQVVRGFQRAVDPAVWADARAAAGGELALLLGEVRGGQRSPAAGDGGFGLYDAVATLLVTVSRSVPVVVVLDDLHWADAASVRLLEFVARHTWFERLLVVGTYREVEVEAAGHPLAPLILPLVAKATTVPLTGLDRDGVRVLLARTAGREPSDEIVTEVHRRTGGNPFFVDQTAHLWHRTNSVDAVAPGVRDAIEQRLALLPGAVFELLTSASVLGPVFHRHVLAAASGAHAGRVDALLGEAVSARLVVPVDDGLRPARDKDRDNWVSLPGRCAFVHDLVRQTLYQRLDAAAARRAHAAVVHAFGRARALAAQTSPADLAHHAYHAVPDVAPADAVALLEAAARDANGRQAFEEAVGHHRRALELTPGDRPRDRAAIALQLALAQQVVGEMAASRQTLDDVAATARKLDDPELLARAALRLRGAAWLSGDEAVVARATELINDAHAALIGGRPARGAGRRDQTLDPEPAGKTDLGREQELAARTVDLARAGGDDEALWDALMALHDAVWTPGTAAERERIAQEMAVVAHRTSEPYAELFASMLRLMVLLELGDPRCLAERDTLLALARRMDSTFARDLGMWVRGEFAALTGSFDDARALIDEADRLMRQRFGDALPYDRSALHYQQQCTIDVLQGRTVTAADAPRPATEGGSIHLRLLETLMAVRRGDVDLGLRYVSEATAAGEDPPRWFAPLWLRLQAEVAAASGDPRRCAEARAALAPLTGQWAMLFGDVPHGPYVHWLALVDAAEERWEDAIGGFTAARDAADRLGARPASIQARAGLAGALLGRGASGDAETAAALLDEVEWEALEIGMLQVVEQVRQVRRDWRDRVRLPAATAVTAATGDATTSGAASAAEEADTVNAFRRDGRVWTLSFGGRTVHVPDAKGLRDLHTLLGRPGADVRAVELLNPQGGELARAARQMGGDAVLDEAAKAAYRERLTRLDEQIDRALGGHDDGRAAELDREREALIDELRRVTGLGGRARRLGDDAERARKAVFERIRDTLRRLDQTHPELAQHLRASVSTGTSCRYQPPSDIRWTL